jgi:NAD(P)H-flavin reductase
MNRVLKPAAVHPDEFLAPRWAEVHEIVEEIPGTSTFWLRFQEKELQRGYRFLPGQFNMLYLPNYGEAAISISSNPHQPGRLGHTIRFVGNVTRAVSRVRRGSPVGVRGPFGAHWPMSQARGKDVVLASGGIGLAPLRSVIYDIKQHRSEFERVVLLHGARTPADILFQGEFDKWRDADIEVLETVDRADEAWQGPVGVVPMLFYRLRLNPEKTVVFSCGPEIMMRFVVYEALARRIPKESIYLSLERNMKCGGGLCGHCQFGPYFVCRDGPVFSFQQLEPYFQVEDL